MKVKQSQRLQGNPQECICKRKWNPKRQGSRKKSAKEKSKSKRNNVK